MTVVQPFLICLGAFIVQMVVVGVENNFGLIYYHLLREFGESNGETAFIGSLATGLTFLVSPLSNIILLKCGYAVHIILSTLLCVLAWATSSCVNSIHMLLLTYSVLWGFGSGFANHAALVAIQQHFTKRLSLANGIVTSGAGVGTLVLGPLLELLFSAHKFKWAFRVFSLVPIFNLISLVSLAFKKPDFSVPTSTVEKPSVKSDPSLINDSIDSEMGRLMKHNTRVESYTQHGTNHDMLLSTDVQDSLDEKDRSVIDTIFDKELWSNKSLVFYTIGMSIFLFGYLIPFTFLVEYATRQGIGIKRAQFLVGLMAIAATVAKILFGAIMDSQKLIKRSTFILIVLYLMSLSHLIVPFSKTYWHFSCFSVIFGTLDGCFWCQICAVIVDLVGNKEKVGAAIGNLFAFMSIGFMTGPVVAGSLISVVNSYATPFYVASTVSLVGSILTTFIKIYEKSSNSLERSNNDSETREMNLIE